MMHRTTATRRTPSRSRSIVYSEWNMLGARSAEADDRVDGLDAAVTTDVAVRGWYDVSVRRADADLMVWWTANSPGPMQAAQGALLLLPLEAAELHRTADLLRDVPARRARVHVCEESAFYSGRRIESSR